MTVHLRGVTVARKANGKQLFFTEKGLAELNAEIDRLESRRSEMMAEVGEALTDGDQYHDNFTYEQLQRQLADISHQIEALKSRLSHALVTKAEESTSNTVQIGRTVRIDRNGFEETWTIAGHGESNPDEGVIAYDTALADVLLDHKVGDSIKTEIRGKQVDLVILEIT
jgi:transcription elongation factor GreA